MIAKLTAWAKRLKRDIAALFIALKDSRTPFLAKVVAGIVVAYALSPIDLIPDFIPILGYIDDLILLPLGIWLAVRLIDEPLLTEFRHKSESVELLPKSLVGAAVVVAIWFLLIVVMARYIFGF